MLDLRIESLRIHMENAAGHEHRIHRIASRAAVIFGERLGERVKDSAGAAEVDGLNAQPVNMNLNGTSDEQAASAIAESWLDALALRLKI
jgi:hypothetical protein